MSRKRQILILILLGLFSTATYAVNLTQTQTCSIYWFRSIATVGGWTGLNPINRSYRPKTISVIYYNTLYGNEDPRYHFYVTTKEKTGSVYGGGAGASHTINPTPQEFRSPSNGQFRYISNNTHIIEVAVFGGWAEDQRQSSTTFCY